VSTSEVQSSFQTQLPIGTSASAWSSSLLFHSETRAPVGSMTAAPRPIVP